MYLAYIFFISFSLTKAAILSKSRSLEMTKYNCSKTVDWRPSRRPKIIGGEVPPDGAVPWQITLRTSDTKHLCGGALIGNRLVLSAAHCYMEGLTAVAGAHGPHGTSPYEQTVKVDKFIRHPDFTKLGPYSHDIAVLILADPGFVFDNIVRPVCIPKNDPSPGTWCEISGWGAQSATDIETVANILQVAAVPVISLDVCRGDNVYGGFHQTILDSMLCAGYLEGKIDACKGDSGGPLACSINGKWELAGIVSWGDGCAQRNKPGMYTSVASFTEWIQETITEEGLSFHL